MLPKKRADMESAPAILRGFISSSAGASPRPTVYSTIRQRKQFLCRKFRILVKSEEVIVKK